MRLSLDAIVELLSKDFGTTSLNLRSGKLTRFDFPELYTAGEKLKSGHLYIVNGFDLPDIPWMQENVGLISIGAPPSSYVRQRCSVLELEEDEVLEAVYSSVAQTYWRFQQWELELARLLEERADIQAFLEVTFPLVEGNALWCVDSNHVVLGHIEKDRDGEIQRNLINTGSGASQVPMQWFLDNLSSLSSHTHQKEATIDQMEIEGRSYQVLFKKLHDGEANAITVTMADTSCPFRKSDYLILEVLSDVIGKNIVDNLARITEQVNGMHNIFHDILHGEEIDAETASSHIRKYGLDEKGSFVCLCLRILGDLPQMLLLSAFRSHVSKYIDNVYVAYNDPDIVLFSYFPPNEEKDRNIQGRFSCLLKEGGFVAGVSNEFTSITEARFYYNQARIAIEQGVRSQPGAHFHYFSDYALTYIMKRAHSELPIKHLCHHGVVKLHQADIETGSEYCRTLKVFFENKQNAVQSARELFIHRSTFLYRLSQIKKVLSYDLDDYYINLYVTISLELLTQLSE